MPAKRQSIVLVLLTLACLPLGTAATSERAPSRTDSFSATKVPGIADRSLAASASGDGLISGMVRDSVSGAALAGIPVGVFDFVPTDPTCTAVCVNTAIAGTKSLQDGSYSIQVPAGRYFVCNAFGVFGVQDSFDTAHHYKCWSSDPSAFSGRRSPVDVSAEQGARGIDLALLPASEWDVGLSVSGEWRPPAGGSNHWMLEGFTGVYIDPPTDLKPTLREGVVRVLDDAGVVISEEKRGWGPNTEPPWLVSSGSDDTSSFSVPADACGVVSRSDVKRGALQPYPAHRVGAVTVQLVIQGSVSREWTEALPLDGAICQTAPTVPTAIGVRVGRTSRDLPLRLLVRSSPAVALKGATISLWRAGRRLAEVRVPTDSANDSVVPSRWTPVTFPRRLLLPGRHRLQVRMTPAAGWSSSSARVLVDVSDAR